MNDKEKLYKVLRNDLTADQAKLLVDRGKKGGKIIIKCNEPCYIIGIASITPNVDYSQGNDWDMMQLDTMDDLHKPQLDGIGYQDLTYRDWETDRKSVV